MSPFRGAARTVSRLKSRLRARTEEDRNIRYITASVAVLGLTQAGTMAYLPIFLARSGASAAQLALLTSAPAVVAVLVLIPAGLFAERFANQVQLRVRFDVVVRTSSLILAVIPFLVPASSIPIVVIILWSVRAIGMAVASLAFMTVMSMAVPPDRRARVNGVRWAMMSIISTVFTAVFGRMLDLIIYPLNYQIVFMVSFVGAAGAVFLFSRIRVPPLDVIPRKPWRAKDLTQGVRSYVHSILESRVFIRYLLSTLMLRVAMSMPAALLTLYWVNELKASDTWIGLRGTVGYASLVIGYLAWGKIASRVKHRRVLYLSTAVLGLYPIGTALIPSAPWMLPVAALWGLSTSGINIVLMDLMLASAPKDRMPRLSSVRNLVANASAVAGPLLGVMLAQATSLRVGLLVIGVIQVLSMATFWLLPKDV